MHNNQEELMEKKFTVLRVIATLYKIVGVLVALGTILLVIFEIVGAAAGTRLLENTFGLFNTGPALGIFSAITTFIAGGLSALGIFAIGEAIYVLINLEENTRFTAIIMRDRFYPQQMPPPAMTSNQPTVPPTTNPPYPPPA
jgi:hypothetical protein